jgi:RNA polymerase primary sigma factor
MKNHPRTHETALDLFTQGLQHCPPLGSEEEDRLLQRMWRLRMRLVRVLDRLPEPHRRRLAGTGVARQAMRFVKLDAVVARLEREARESRDARLDAAARRARALHRLLGSERSALVTRNLRLVYHLARRLARRGPLLADLVQLGNVGLVEAADRFDPRRGVRFSTYAGMCIAGMITKKMPALTASVHVPSHQLRALSRLHRSRRGLTMDLGREPTLEEMAAQADVPEGKARRILATQPTVLDLDAPVAGLDDVSMADTLAAGEESAQERTILRDQIGRMERALASLDPRMRTVLRLRYGLGGARERTLREIGASMRLSRERIRQLEEEATRLLRVRMRRGPEVKARPATAARAMRLL